jgi:hypothetical protein
VENTHASESRCNVAFNRNFQIESLVAPQLLARSHENNVSTRDRPARTGADARIKESAASGEVRLALRPYGREFKLDFGMPSQLPGWQGTLVWQRLGPIRARSGGSAVLGGSEASEYESNASDPRSI